VLRCCQPLDFGVNLGDVAPQQRFSGLARACPVSRDGEQLAYLGQPQAEPLGAPVT